VKSHGNLKNPFMGKEVVDNSLSIVRTTSCACIVNPDKILLGADD